MSYLVLARKFRPQAFAEVTGQEHVTRSLTNAIKRGKVAHAYLFAGPRGVGKTSIARIFSKCLNCVEGPTDSPCLKCTNCTGIALGTSLAVREIDGASHNSVDNVRELIETFRSLPAPGSKYKIYIIDEVHMLSVSAFNALLKSLEEPPPHTVFILATTEAHKIPDTVISRCQRHELRALTAEQVETRLRAIAVTECMEVEDEVFPLIARLSEGSMRDAQSLLDRVHSFCDGRLSVSDAVKVLGVVDRSVLFKLSQAIFDRDPTKVLEGLQEVFSFGIDPSLFLKEFVTHWREILIAKVAGSEGLKRIGVTRLTAEFLLGQVEKPSLHDIQDLAYLARQSADSALRSAYPKVAFEALLVRMATREPVRDLTSLINEMKRVDLRSGGGGGGTSSAREGTLAGSNRSSGESVPRIIRQPQAGSAAPALVSETRVATEAPPVVELHWENFVREIKTTGILLEQLKRLSVEEFSPGILKARGPEFSVAYLQQKTNKEKLEIALAAYSRHESWTILLQSTGTAGSAETGSILYNERVREKESREEKTKDLASHPKIKSLQKLFPGSTIENIKLKSE